MTKIYDEVCGWPYSQPYGMVTAPKPPKARKPRKSRAMPQWLKEQRKVLRTQPRLPKGWRYVKTPLVEHPPKDFATTFTSCAMRECEE